MSLDEVTHGFEASRGRLLGGPALNMAAKS